MSNRMLIVMVLMCLGAHPVSAMKTAGSVVIEGERPCKRLRVEGVEEVDMRTDDPFKSTLDGLDMSKKFDVFKAIKKEDFYGFTCAVAGGINPNKRNSRKDNNPLLITFWLSDFTPEQKKEGYRLLKARGVDINAGSANTEATVLHFASLEGDGPFFDELVQDGANVYGEDCDEATPLFYARNPEMIEKNLQYGAYVNHQNMSQQTALFGIAGQDEADSAKKLVLFGADCEIKDDRGRTAYERHEQKYGDANPAIKSNKAARDKIVMPRFTQRHGNPVAFVLNREITGKPMSNRQLAADQ